MATTKSPSKPEKEQGLRVERERSQFRALLLQNANFFGNLKDSPFKAVTSIVSNTSYEELKCVGFQPQLNRLEAVVWVKRESGYSGDVCSPGSPEYVRFWLSYDDGVTWLDQGMDSFTAYDIPGDHPLEYAVTLSITPRRRLCFFENLPLVRAILSWNDPPTDPNTPPVWGNVLEARIQIAPRPLLDFPDLFTDFKVEIPPLLADLIEPAQTLKLKAPLALNAAQLQAAYAGKDVPEHRFLHGEIQKYIAQPGLAAIQPLQPKVPFSALKNIDVAAVVGKFFATSGDTSFEELTCVGLDPAPSTPDALVGAVKIKRPTGYLGGLCGDGSIEYVAFWVDWGDGVWDWVGTAQVRVHDVTSIPREGLYYAVYLPVNLEPHRRPCLKGATTARVRAILSWNEAPPPGNPDFPPHWGNRLETRIHIYAGTPVAIGDYRPYMQSLCGIPLCHIDQTTGFASGESPFGGAVYIYGHIPGAPEHGTWAATPPANRLRYRITVRPAGTTTLDEYLNNAFGITVDEQSGGGLPTSTDIVQTADSANYYVYQEASPDSTGWRTVTPSRLLAIWDSSGKTGRWEIQIDALDPVTGITYAAGTVICIPSGETRQNVIVDLDQAAPVVHTFRITGYQRGGAGPVLTDQLNCGTFQVGDVIHGEYNVTDEHFAGLGLTAEPLPDGGSGRFTITGAPTSTGQSGTWTFNAGEITALGLPPLDPCGYTIQLSTSDRTIVSCGGPWQNNSEFVGFCLVAPEE
jgi:hypothetical protein